MGGWRTSVFTLVPKLLLVPMIVLGPNQLPPTSAKLQPSFHGKNLSSSDAAATCAEELMALYSGPVRAASLSEARADELRSCVRPLVPYHEISPPLGCRGEGEADGVVPSSRRRRLQMSRSGVQSSSVDELMDVNARLLSGGVVDDDAQEKVERLVQWPPSQVLSLARRTVVFGGDPSAVLSELSPIKHPVPDVQNSTAEKCYLTKYDYGKRFEDNVINSYIVFLYHAISMLSPFVGFNVSLNRFDLFHGHMFSTYDTNRLGILFHSREYPQYDEKIFPINLGYCQKGSKIPYDKSMDLRNILWLAPLAACTDKGVCSDDWLASGVLFILDAKEGGVVYRELIPEYLDDVRTVSEEEFGYLVADVNYLNLDITPPESRVFIC
ncbi:hypothetical protein KC19_VG236700 [Ceratodon purpureus]|uniref:Uncharacterized protein n=1 Tax=Ceratodon purpureus TaxID=3225 RepID=A0A8T0HT07_CERPU|nr:hypothetical protein KC19_VG236700 [Ceratodon purpureus]